MRAAYCTPRFETPPLPSQSPLPPGVGDIVSSCSESIIDMSLLHKVANLHDVVAHWRAIATALDELVDENTVSFQGFVQAHQWLNASAWKALLSVCFEIMM